MASFDKFIKLMMMTTSSHDGEVLNAIRMANAMLGEMNNNWEELLRGKVRMEAESTGRTESRDYQPSGKIYNDEMEINKMFEEAYRRVSRHSSFMRYVDSVHEWWEERGFLTEKQYEAIKKAAYK